MNSEAGADPPNAPALEANKRALVRDSPLGPVLKGSEKWRIFSEQSNLDWMRLPAESAGQLKFDQSDVTL